MLKDMEVERYELVFCGEYQSWNFNLSSLLTTVSLSPCLIDASSGETLSVRRSVLSSGVGL